MPRHNPQICFRHMLEYARMAVSLLTGKNRVALERDPSLGMAVCRAVEIVGEAANRIPEKVRDSHPNIPWQKIIGMRNRLMHGYDLLDYDIIWNTVNEDLPALISELEKIVPPDSAS